MITNHYETPSNDRDAIIQALSYRAERVRFYGETFSDWAEFCAEAAGVLEDYDEHDECWTQDMVDEALSDERDRADKWQAEANENDAEIKRLRARIAELETGPRHGRITVNMAGFDTAEMKPSRRKTKCKNCDAWSGQSPKQTVIPAGSTRIVISSGFGPSTKHVTLCRDCAEHQLGLIEQRANMLRNALRRPTVLRCIAGGAQC